MAQSHSPKEIESHEAVILGAGPAGISCALGLHEMRADYILLERGAQIGGQLQFIENTIRDFASSLWQSGHALRADMEAQCNRIGVRIRTNQNIETVDLANKTFTAGGKAYKARSLFLATGAKVRKLSFKGDQSISGCILYDSEKHEELLTGKTVAVVGGGDNALMDALWLAERCPSVLVISRSAQIKARPDVVRDVLRHPVITTLKLSEVVELTQEHGRLKFVFVLDKESGQIKQYQVDFLLVKAGYSPNSELFAEQLATDDSGHVLVDLSCQTSLRGVYAGGDLVAPEVLHIGRAVGHGIVAAQAMLHYLRDQF